MNKDFEHVRFSVPLVLAALLLLVIIGAPVSATGATPPDNYVSVLQGGTFLLSGSITFDQPNDNGYFTWVMYWYHYGDPTENFTVENVSVYWTSDNTPVENVSIDDYGIFKGHQVAIMDNDSAGGVGAIVRDGTFTIDIWLRAASGDGTPHKADNQWIYFSAGGKIIVYEPDPDLIDAPSIYVDVTGVISPGVDVSISPGYRTGQPGENVTFTVTVTNTGESADSYNLQVTASTDWFPDIEPASLTLDPGESGNAVLSVTVPSDVSGGDTGIMEVRAISTEDSAIQDHDTCRVIVEAAEEEGGVDVSISPGESGGLSDENVTFTVTVMNTGESADSYNLQVTASTGWSPGIEPASLTLDPDESGNAVLSVTVPSDVSGGDTGIMEVRAISTEDSAIQDHDTCRVIVEAAEEEREPSIHWDYIILIAALIAGVVFAAGYLVRR